MKGSRLAKLNRCEYAIHDFVTVFRRLMLLDTRESLDLNF